MLARILFLAALCVCVSGNVRMLNKLATTKYLDASQPITPSPQAQYIYADALPAPATSTSTPFSTVSAPIPAPVLATPTGPVEAVSVPVSPISGLVTADVIETDPHQLELPTPVNEVSTKNVVFTDTIRCPSAHVSEVYGNQLIQMVTDRPSVVFFYGPTCIHTSAFTPLFECLAARFPEIQFLKMSAIDDVARDYCTATPTVRFFPGNVFVPDLNRNIAIPAPSAKTGKSKNGKHAAAPAFVSAPASKPYGAIYTGYPEAEMLNGFVRDMYNMYFPTAGPLTMLDQSVTSIDMDHPELAVPPSIPPPSAVAQPQWQEVTYAALAERSAVAVQTQAWAKVQAHMLAQAKVMVSAMSMMGMQAQYTCACEA